MHIDDIKPIIQDKSEINIFNTIGELAKYNGFKVEYFKNQFLTVDTSSIDNTLDSNSLDISKAFESFKIKVSSYIHYIHIIKKKNKKKKIISIYYDDSSALARIDHPYYELCSDDICRYFVNEELNLYNDVKKIIMEVK